MLTIYIFVGAVAIPVFYESMGYIFLLVFISAWATDSGAHLIGSAIGKRKLWPEISPNKTIAGAVGGIVVNIIAFIAFAFIIQSLNTHGTNPYTDVNFIMVVILAVASSIVVIMGDLVESMIKRQYNIKDFGNIMPGHGGIFDRFDSIIAVAPVLLALAAWLRPFEEVWHGVLLIGG